MGKMSKHYKRHVFEVRTLIGEKIIMQQDNKQTTGKPMVVSIESIRSECVGKGTGFFVTENLIATNIHCIAGALSVSGKHIDSNTDYDVEGIAAYDALNDLVILKVDSEGTPFPIYDSDQVEKGETVKAIGCPHGEYVHSEGKFYSTLNNGQWLLTTAKTNNGYSGGPLLNDKGQIIGINFGSISYYSIAITSNILKSLLSWARLIEPLAQWQKREQISAYDHLVKSKGKVKTKTYDAIDDLDQAIQLWPDYNIAYINRGDAKKYLAESKYGQGDLVEAQKLHQSAIDDYTEAIRLCPDFLGGLNGRGFARTRLGQFKTEEEDFTEGQKYLLDAINDFTEVIKLFPDYTPAYNSRANAKLHLAKSKADSENIEQSQKLYKDAMTNINIAIQKHAHNPIEENMDTALFHHTRGEIKEAMGDLHGAIEDFKNAIKNTEYTKNSTISNDLERVKEALTKQG